MLVLCSGCYSDGAPEFLNPPEQLITDTILHSLICIHLQAELVAPLCISIADGEDYFNEFHFKTKDLPIPPKAHSALSGMRAAVLFCRCFKQCPYLMCMCPCMFQCMCFSFYSRPVLSRWYLRGLYGGA